MTTVDLGPPQSLSEPPYIPEMSARLEIIQASEGFYPATRDETNRAANLLNDRYAGARHLGEVYRHQIKADQAEVADLEEVIGYHDATIIEDVRTPIDPAQASRRVLWTLGQYGIRARSDLASLGKLGSALQETGGSRHVAVAEELRMADVGIVEYEGNLYEGWPQLLRFRDLARFSGDLGDEPAHPALLEVVRDSDGYPICDVYTGSPNRPDVATYFDQALESLSLGEAAELAEQATVDQANRLAFWKRILHNVVQYQVSKDMKLVAKRILISIDMADLAK